MNFWKLSTNYAEILQKGGAKMGRFEKDVRKALIDRDMTMTDLAGVLGISIGYVSDLLKGKRNNPVQITKIMSYLDMDPKDYEDPC